jgi:hypothetical protein
MPDDILTAKEREVRHALRLFANGRSDEMTRPMADTATATIDRLCARVREAEAELRRCQRAWDYNADVEPVRPANPVRRDIVQEAIDVATAQRPADPPVREEPVVLESTPGSVTFGAPPPDPSEVAEVREHHQDEVDVRNSGARMSTEIAVHSRAGEAWMYAAELADEAHADRATLLKHYDAARRETEKWVAETKRLVAKNDDALKVEQNLRADHDTQASRIRELEEELQNIVTVDWRKWDKEMRDPLDWVQWAKSRARAVLAKGAKP